MMDDFFGKVCNKKYDLQENQTQYLHIKALIFTNHTILTYKQLKYVTTKYSVAPRNTYNMDKKGFILGIGKITKWICRNARKDSQFKEYTNRESCTVVESISVDGFVVTPLTIFKGQNHLAGWYKEKKE